MPVIYYPVSLVFSLQIFDKCSNMKSHANLPRGSPVVPCTRMERHDEASSGFPQFPERAYKWKKHANNFVPSFYYHGNFTVLYKNIYNSSLFALKKYLSNKLNDFQADWWHFMSSATTGHTNFEFSIP